MVNGVCGHVIVAHTSYRCIGSVFAAYFLVADRTGGSRRTRRHGSRATRRPTREYRAWCDTVSCVKSTVSDD